MNYMQPIAQILGLRLDEEFTIKIGKIYPIYLKKCRLSEKNGLIVNNVVDPDTLLCLLTGKYQIIKHS